MCYQLLMRIEGLTHKPLVAGSTPALGTQARLKWRVFYSSKIGA
jgi:hypothetical protein